ncbi:MAG: ion channel [Candidatus Electrothrix sp. GW3-4]|uniref:potassium channel family protein n=1 Tax=Candidatus Electrothrix sp. GW3-4 TaxID=3126740 RepID=UPI0030D393C2
MKKRLKQLYLFLQRENLLYLFAVIFTIVLVSSVLIAWFEPEVSFASGLWWSIVTLTTVGYGDISPATPAGRVLAVLVMFFGIGLLGMLSAGLATILISRKMRENRGMCPSTVEDHIIICEWNHRAKAILKELRADVQTEQTSVVLVADIEEIPVDDPNLLFIRGVVCEETLEKANLKKAQTIIVLGDDAAETTARDAKVVLTTLTIESMNPEVYSVVELVDKRHEPHCLRANADEIIIGSELSSHLIASAASDHGISRVVTELLSSRYGNELYSMPVPVEMAGKKFLDVFVAMKTEHNVTVFGIQKGRAGAFLPNPDAEYPVTAEDLLLVISRDRIRK